MEYVLGPVLAVLVTLKFADFNIKKQTKVISSLEEKVLVLEKNVKQAESEVPKKMMATLLPVAKAVNKINQQLGL
jgi:hypothetical protein